MSMTKGTPVSSQMIWMEQRIATLEAELAEANKRYNNALIHASNAERYLNEQLDLVKRDAERYRWLRKLDWEIKRKTPLSLTFNQDDDDDESTNSHVLDAAIDEAMEETNDHMA